jgi:hypothetical protein
MLSDFTVAAEGGVKYHAHRCLLACRSEFFRSLLQVPRSVVENTYLANQSGMKEAQSGELYLPMAPAVAEVVLRFVLTDQACKLLLLVNYLPTHDLLPAMEPERAVELLSVAGMLPAVSLDICRF